MSPWKISRWEWLLIAVVLLVAMVRLPTIIGWFS